MFLKTTPDALNAVTCSAAQAGCGKTSWFAKDLTCRAQSPRRYRHRAPQALAIVGRLDIGGGSR